MPNVLRNGPPRGRRLEVKLRRSGLAAALLTLLAMIGSVFPPALVGVTVAEASVSAPQSGDPQSDDQQSDSPKTEEEQPQSGPSTPKDEEASPGDTALVPGTESPQSQAAPNIRGASIQPFADAPGCSYANAFLGSTTYNFYTGVQGKPALNNTAGSTQTVTYNLEDIQVLKGGQRLSGYGLVVADAESTDDKERIDWSTTAGSFTLLPNAPGNNMGNACAGGFAINGTAAYCVGQGTGQKTGTPMLVVSAPASQFAVTQTLKPNALSKQGVAFALIFATAEVEVEVDDRITSVDQFQASMTASQLGGTITAATSGGDKSASTGVQSPHCGSHCGTCSDGRGVASSSKRISSKTSQAIKKGNGMTTKKTARKPLKGITTMRSTLKRVASIAGVLAFSSVPVLQPTRTRARAIVPRCQRTTATSTSRRQGR